MGALSGQRPGKMLALRWADLQLPEGSGEPGVARIRRSLSRLPSGKLLIRETTKTGRGRAVHLLHEVVAAFKAHRRRQLEERMAKGASWDEQDLVFPNVAASRRTATTSPNATISQSLSRQACRWT
jgi:integrase